MKEFFINDKEKFNAANRAEGVLDHILDETSTVTLAQRKNEASVEDELRKERLIEDSSTRVRSRVLFITRDKKVLEKGSAMQKHFINLAEVFDEVHVIVLGLGKRKTDTMRLASKVWVYPTISKYFLQQPFTAIKIAKQQLKFTDGFRPDIVVALDSFESGIAGYFIARKFKRAFQVQIIEDFYNGHFKEELEYNAWRLRFSHFVLKRVKSVRVDTDTLKQKINARYKNITDVALLPQYFNIKETMQSVQDAPAEKLYPQFSFLILFVGVLDQNSTLFRAIDAVRPLLRTPSIGFVVIGDGSAKETFQERTRLLSVDAQVIFKPKTADVFSNMRSANVLICTDTDNESESVVVKAAATGLPAVMAKTILREDLFTDGEDSFLCDPEDTIEFSQKLVKFLNTNAMRSQFSKNAKDVVRNRIEEDPKMYRIALRDSIEAVLYLEEATRVRIKAELKKKETLKIAKIVEKENKKIKKEEVEKQKQRESLKKANHGIDMKIPGA